MRVRRPACAGIDIAGDCLPCRARTACACAHTSSTHSDPFTTVLLLQYHPPSAHTSRLPRPGLPRTHPPARAPRASGGAAAAPRPPASSGRPSCTLTSRRQWPSWVGVWSSRRFRLVLFQGRRQTRDSVAPARPPARPPACPPACPRAYSSLHVACLPYGSAQNTRGPWLVAPTAAPFLTNRCHCSPRLCRRPLAGHPDSNPGNDVAAWPDAHQCQGKRVCAFCQWGRHWHACAHASMPACCGPPRPLCSPAG